MAEGRHGYDVTIGYTANFFREMGPDWLDFCIRVQGFDRPNASRSYRYLDLGCGQGFHLCLLAAANPEAEFVGVDFDPAHIVHAQELAAASGVTNASFIQADFLDLADHWPEELGTFDYIVLQGILSWISPELRAAAFKCVAQASNDGTVASFGYNTPPGWLSAMPFQHVANQFSRSRDADAALRDAIGMFRRMRDAKAQLFERMPHFKSYLDVLARQSSSYLAHEYLPNHWAPLWHSEVAQQLRSTGFIYVGSGSIAEALLPDSLPSELASIIRQQDDGSLREDVQDIVIMQTFRSDIFCRNPRRAESASDLDTPIYLIAPPPEGAPVHFQTSFGGLTVDYAVVADILAALADGPKPAAALMEIKNPRGVDTRSILLSMLEARMLSVGRAVPASPKHAARFNAALARAASAGKTYNYLAAAALGSGAPVTELDLLMVDTWMSGHGHLGRENLARGVAQRLMGLGRQLQFRGSAVADDQLESHIAHLIPMFVDQLVPKFRMLGIIE